MRYIGEGVVFRKIKDLFIEHTLKAVVGAIFVGVIGGFTFLKTNYGEQVLLLIRSVTTSVWSWFFASHAINNTLALFLIYPLACVGLLFIFFRLLPDKKQVNYENYTRDVFDGILLSWTWTYGGDIDFNRPLCNKCMFELEFSIYPLYNNYAECKSCGAQYNLPIRCHSEYNLLDYYRKRIRQIVNSGKYLEKLRGAKK